MGQTVRRLVVLRPERAGPPCSLLQRRKQVMLPPTRGSISQGFEGQTDKYETAPGLPAPRVGNQK